MTPFLDAINITAKKLYIEDCIQNTITKKIELKFNVKFVENFNDKL